MRVGRRLGHWAAPSLWKIPDARRHTPAYSPFAMKRPAMHGTWRQRRPAKPSSTTSTCGSTWPAPWNGAAIEATFFADVIGPSPPYRGTERKLIEARLRLPSTTRRRLPTRSAWPPSNPGAAHHRRGDRAADIRAPAVEHGAQPNEPPLFQGLCGFHGGPGRGKAQGGRDQRSGQRRRPGGAYVRSARDRSRHQDPDAPIGELRVRGVLQSAVRWILGIVTERGVTIDARRCRVRRNEPSARRHPRANSRPAR
jgi:hypothetical protein